MKTSKLMGLVLSVAVILIGTTQVQAQQQQRIVEMPRLDIVINEWDPPSDANGVIEVCGDLAQENNVDPYEYCKMLTMFCEQFSLTINECYGYMAEPEIIPQRVREGLLEKVYNQ